MASYLAYLAELETAAEAKPSHLSMGASPRQYRYLDLAFIREAQAVLDKAEAAIIGGDATLLRRVRHARLPLDRASLVLYPQLVREHVAAGGDPQEMPLDRHAIAARCKETWHAQIDLRIPEGQRAAERAKADAEIGVLVARKAYVPLPEKFRGLPAGSAFQYTAEETRNWQDIVKRVADAEAESGIANRLELDADTMQPGDKSRRPYRLPMPWGLYDQVNKDFSRKGTIQPADVPGPGYHWYKIGTFVVKPSDYVYFFWSWIIQVDVDDAVDPRRPGQRFDVWACLKFEGPAFPHGKPGEKNAICVERVVLAKAEGRQ
ncbi:MAG: hypothetical protein FJ290_31135 [Planctomycetes bacterium]|nr:hypothetical protein [Planctomycetota bacterium]